MDSYSLRYVAPGQARIVHFMAEDAAEALFVAHELAREQSAELWQGGFRLCNVNRAPAREWRPGWLGT